MDLGMLEEEQECLVELEVDETVARCILKSAINDYLGYVPGREPHDLAELWLFTDFAEEKGKEEEALEGFVSLSAVCEILDSNQEKVRIMTKCHYDQGKKRLVDSQLEAMLRSCKI